MMKREIDYTFGLVSFQERFLTSPKFAVALVRMFFSSDYILIAI